MNTNDYLSTYKFFDHKGRRLSIFGRQKENKIEMFIWTCSKKDSFNKHIGRDAYTLPANEFDTKYPNLHPIHPQIFEINIEEENTFKYTFLHYCFSNFFKIVERRVVFIEELLYNYETGNNKSRGTHNRRVHNKFS